MTWRDGRIVRRVLARMLVSGLLAGSGPLFLLSNPATALAVDVGTKEMGNVVQGSVSVKSSSDDADPDTFTYTYYALKESNGVNTGLQAASGATANTISGLQTILSKNGASSCPTINTDLAILTTTVATPAAVIYWTWNGQAGYQCATSVNGYSGAVAAAAVLGISSYTTSTNTLTSSGTWDVNLSATSDGTTYTGTARTNRYEAAATIVGTTADTTAPSAPSGVTVTDATSSGRLNLAWTNAGDSDLNHVTIYRSTSSGTTGTLIYTTTSQDTTSYANTGLTNGTTYYYTIRSVDTVGNESTNTTQTSGVPTDGTDTTPPSAPSGVSATDAGTDGDINLAWTNPSNSDFDHSTIYRSTSSGTTGSLIHTTTSSSTASYANSGLTNGTTYYYTVRSVDTTGNESTNTTQVSATPTAPDTTPPSAPTGVGVTNATTGGTLTLAWTNASESDFDHVVIYRSTSSGTTGSVIQTTSSSSTASYSNTGLTDGTTYYYTIRSVDTTGNVSTNTTQTSGIPTDTTAPSAPSAVSASNAGTGGVVSLSWTNPSASDFDHVTIYRSIASGELGSLIATTPSSSTSTYSSSGLTNGTAYYYTLRAVDTTGNVSSSSTQVTATPSDTTAPSAPSGVSASAGSASGTATVSWTNPTDSDFDHVVLYRSTNSGTLGPALATSTSTSYADSGLTNGTTYYYTVRSVDTTGNASANTTQASATPSSGSSSSTTTSTSTSSSSSSSSNTATSTTSSAATTATINQSGSSSSGSESLTAAASSSTTTAGLINSTAKAQAAPASSPTEGTPPDTSSSRPRVPTPVGWLLMIVVGGSISAFYWYRRAH